MGFGAWVLGVLPGELWELKLIGWVVMVPGFSYGLVLGAFDSGGVCSMGPYL